jgi:hypothetical protein
MAEREGERARPRIKGATVSLILSWQGTASDSSLAKSYKRAWHFEEELLDVENQYYLLWDFDCLPIA